MTVLNNADNIYLGKRQVDRIYVGATLVWPGSPIPPSGLPWNSEDCSVNMILSNNNYTATATSNGARVRLVQSQNSGKRMFAAQAVTLNKTDSVDLMLGIANSAQDMEEGSGYPGLQSGTAVVVNTNPGDTEIMAGNGDIRVSLSTEITEGDWVLFLIDFDNSLVWVRINDGIYEAGSGAGDPETGTNGIDISEYFTGAGYPFMAGWPYGNTSPSYTVDATGADYPYSTPTGWNWFD